MEKLKILKLGRLQDSLCSTSSSELELLCRACHYSDGCCNLSRSFDCLFSFMTWPTIHSLPVPLSTESSGLCWEYMCISHLTHGEQVTIIITVILGTSTNSISHRLFYSLKNSIIKCQRESEFWLGFSENLQCSS